METYSFLRQMADSWALLLMTAMFVGIIIWAFRPGGRKVQHEAATAIFRNEDRPARDPSTDDKEART
ncbi:MAG: cbb3-type cytochrome c oxidase subunit 3 [Gemmobacter sp.]